MDTKPFIGGNTGHYYHFCEGNSFSHGTPKALTIEHKINKSDYTKIN